MNAEDVCSSEDRGYVGGGCGVESGLCWWDFGVKSREIWAFGEGVAEEAFAGGSDEDGLVEFIELVEVRQDRIIFVEAFAEAEAGI